MIFSTDRGLRGYLFLLIMESKAFWDCFEKEMYMICLSNKCIVIQMRAAGWKRKARNPVFKSDKPDIWIIKPGEDL